MNKLQIALCKVSDFDIRVDRWLKIKHGLSEVERLKVYHGMYFILGVFMSILFGIMALVELI